MALTYEHDVRPHQRRAMVYRLLRQRRWEDLHKHDGRARVWAVIFASLAAFWGLVIWALV